MQSFEVCSPLKKAQSFWIVEENPTCKSDRDRRIQEVIRPAMLVVSNDRKSTYLIFEQQDK